MAPIPGKAPGNTCPPLEWAWAGGGCVLVGGEGDPGRPAVSLPRPPRRWTPGADGLPRSRGLEDAGKEPAAEGLSYPKNAALGEPSEEGTGWGGGHSLLEAGGGPGGRGRQAGSLGGGETLFPRRALSQSGPLTTLQSPSPTPP